MSRTPSRGGARPLVPRLRAWLALPLLLSACGAASPASPGAEFDAQRAWSHLERQVALGPRHCGSEAIERARVLIEGELGAAGLRTVREAWTEKETPVGDVPMCNLYADLAPRSADPKAPLLILASHYDTKRLGPKFVGANDGGSSTAVLLELARVLAARPPQGLALRFLFLDGEEAFRHDWAGLDNTYGSRYHAARLHEDAELFPRVRAVVLLDMVGDADLRLTVDSYSTKSLRDLFARVARESGQPELFGGYEQAIKDDHLSFRKYDIDAIDLIDFDYDWWHLEGDTLDKCSAASLEKIGKLVLAALPALEERYLPH